MERGAWGSLLIEKKNFFELSLGSDMKQEKVRQSGGGGGGIFSELVCRSLVATRICFSLTALQHSIPETDLVCVYFFKKVPPETPVALTWARCSEWGSVSKAWDALFLLFGNRLRRRQKCGVARPGPQEPQGEAGLPNPSPS